MNICRLGTLTVLFCVFFVANVFLIVTFNHTLQVQKAQQRILAEIATIDNIQADETLVKLGSFEADVKLIDGRAAKLRRYLRSINSPLFDYADLLVEEADKYGYDYRLLVAIALQESTAFRFIPENSYNSWGWGIYGDMVTRFSTYDEAIRTVSDGIKQNYLDKGLITTEQIMKKYTPGSNGSWAWAVRFFFQRLESY